MILFDDCRQVRRHVSPFVQHAAEFQALAKECRGTMAAQVDAKLSKVAKPRSAPIEKDLTFRPARDANESILASRARDDRLVLVSFDCRRKSAVGFPFKCQDDVAGERVIPEEPPHFLIVVVGGDSNVVSPVRRGRTDVQFARSSCPSHA
jgi:hypothetical protein